MLGNDSDPDGDPIGLIDFDDGEFGTVTRSGDSLVYTPDSGFIGPDAFTYTITDGRGMVALGTVDVQVNKPFVAGQYLIDGDFTPDTNGIDDYTAGTTAPASGTAARSRIKAATPAGTSTPDRGDTRRSTASTSAASPRPRAGPPAST